MLIAPSGSETSRSTSPSSLSASSSEPPPISMTTARPDPRSKWASALRKLRRASSSPRSILTFRPVSARTRSRNSSPLSASRTALVATTSQCDERVLNSNLAQSSRFVEPCAQSRRGFHFIHDPDRATRRHIGYRLADRVRSDVDGRDADVRVALLCGRARAEGQMRICGRSHISKLTRGGRKGNCFFSGIFVRPGPRLCRWCR